MRTEAASRRRILALARAEAVLLRRSPLALFTALALPIVLTLPFLASMPEGPDLGYGATLVILMTVTSLLLVVYYNLVTAMVARREDRVLKRLRAGELTDTEILLGTATPAVALATGQILVAVAAAVVTLDLGPPTNALLVVAAVLGGCGVFVLLAAASTALTNTVETAQVTTAPVLFVPLMLSGLVIPFDALPEPVARVAEVMPLTPVVDLLRLGLGGTTRAGDVVGPAASFAPAAGPLLVLACWLLVGGWAARRWFRWEPRR